MYIPLSLPAKLPTYAHVNSSFEWETSALLSMALETATLPSRLRTEAYGRASLGDMSALLNTNGDQRISQLQCHVVDPSTLENTTNPHTIRQARDNRFPSQLTAPSYSSLGNEQAQDSQDFEFDINLSSHLGNPSPLYDRRRRRTSNQENNTHIFGSITCLRSPSALSPEAQPNPISSTEPLNPDTARTPNQLTPNLRRETYAITTPLYPLPTSFPPIFPTRTLNPLSPSVPSVTDHDPTRQLAVYTSLTTSTQLAEQIGALARASGASGMVSVTEREALREGLERVREAYVEGWESGGESDDDD